MKLTVIGSMGAYSAPGRPSSGYLLQHDGFNLMLDFGSGVLMGVQQHIDINDLDAVYLSHYHPDHTADVGCLQHAVKIQTDLGIRKTQLNFYGSPEDPYFEKLDYHDYTLKNPVEPGLCEQIGPFSCTFLLNPHPGGSLAVRLEAGSRSLVYTADTGWNSELPGFASDCGLLLCESSLFEEFRGRVEGHLTAGEAGKAGRLSGASVLALCHFPHFRTVEELLPEADAEFGRKAVLAEPGRVFDLENI